MTNVTHQLTAKKLGSASCPTLVFKYEAILLQCLMTEACMSPAHQVIMWRRTARSETYDLLIATPTPTYYPLDLHDSAKKVHKTVHTTKN